MNLFSSLKLDRKIILFIIFFFNSLCSVFSQGEIDQPIQILYRDEKTCALSINNNGISLNYRYIQRVHEFYSYIYEVNIGGIKHPKEVKIPSNSFYNLQRFVYGKLNLVYTLDIGIGWQKELFQKFDKGSISIRRYFSFGLSNAFVKPIYYIFKVDEDGDTKVDYKTSEKFYYIENMQISEIETKDSFFKGIKELSVTPGAYLKFGFMFEFSKQEKIVSALDGGFLLQAYPKIIPIMAYAKNYSLFPSFFIGYRFGKAFDVRFKERKFIFKKFLPENK